MIPPHLSVSSIRRYMECPRRWAAEKFGGYQSPPGPALLKGTAVDELATANWLYRDEHGENVPDPDERIEDSMRRSVDRAGGREAVRWGRESMPRAIESAIRMGRLHLADHAHLIQPTHLQAEVRRTLPSGMQFVGYIDAVDEDNNLVDVKTGSRRMLQHEADRDIQATGYAYGVGRPITFRWFRVVDAARPFSEVVTSTRSAAALDWFEATADQVAAGMRAGFEAANPGPHCFSCPVQCIAVLKEGQES